jgi:hypothetical protein
MMSEKTNETKPIKPDENNGVYVEGHVKIFDPQTKEVFVNKRS